MGHLQKMTPEQRRNFISWSYKRMLEERRGHYYPYWNDERYKNWTIGDTTKSEEIAIKWRDEMRQIYKKVKIVCGYEKTVQRIRHYTIIYKTT